MSPSKDMNRFLLLPHQCLVTVFIFLPLTLTSLDCRLRLKSSVSLSFKRPAQTNLFPQLSIQDGRSNLVEGERLAFQITDVDGL